MPSRFFSSIFLIALLFGGNLQAATVVFIGDSLTEGYGVPKDKAYPALVEQQFKKHGQTIKVINSGIAGSTSASAPERVKWALKSHPDWIVLALGSNDGLRGLSTSAMKKNLKKAIDLAQKAKVKVILFGMKMPPNYGRKYQQAFSAVFKDLAREEKIPLLPFLLKDVGGVKTLNQADGVHPTEEGHQIMAAHVYDFLKDQIK